MALKVYADRHSQPSRAILIFCKFNNIDFEEVKIELFKGEHKTPEYLEINPMGQVPAIAHGDFKLFESNTILRYLSGAFPKVAEHWYPADLKKRARVDMILDWHHTHTRLGSAPLVMHSVLAPIFGLPINLEAAKESEKILEYSLTAIESLWLKGDSKFLLGNSEPSLADLQIVCELKQLEMTAESDQKRILGPHKKILQLIENVKAFTNPHFEEVHETLYGTIETMRSAKAT